MSSTPDGLNCVTPSISEKVRVGQEAMARKRRAWADWIAATTFCRSSFPSRREAMQGDDRPKPPDLQAWIEKYDAYWKIPWQNWDAVNAKYQHDCRAYLGGPLSEADRKAIKRRARRQ